MIPSVTATLKYQLAELTTAVYDALENSSPVLNVYVASTHSIYSQTNLINRIQAFLHRLWTWIKRKQPLKHPVRSAATAIIHNLFDQVVLRAYELHVHHLSFKLDCLKKLYGNEQIDKQAIFNRYFLELKNQLSTYSIDFSYLEIKFKKCLFRPLSNSNIKLIRKEFIEISEAIFPFWKNFLLYQQTFARILKNFLPKSPPLCSLLQPITGTIYARSLYKILKQEESWFYLESLLERPIPLISIAKSIDSKFELSYHDQQMLDEWLAKLNALKSDKNLLLHLQNILESILQSIYIQTGKAFKLKNSLKALYNKCPILEKAGAIFYRLKEGDKLFYKKETFILGEPILSKSEDGCYSIFSLQNQPNRFIKISHRPLAFHIQSYQFENTHFGVPPAKGVDHIMKASNGVEFAIFQASLPLNSYKWSSSNYFLTDEDKRIGSILSSLFFYAKDQKIWLKNISLDHLYFSEEKSLQTIFPYEFTADDYLSAEATLIEISTSRKEVQNPYILRYLMQVSGYAKHPMAQFYRRYLKAVFETGDCDLLNISLPKNHNQTAYWERLKELVEKARTLRKDCLKKAQDKIKIDENLNNFFLNNSFVFKYQNKAFEPEYKKLQSQLLKIQNELNFASSIDDPINLQELLINKQCLLEQLFEVIVYDKLLSEYLVSDSPATLSYPLIENTLKLFEPTQSVSTKLQKYYEKEQRLIIDKNLKAIQDLQVTST